MKFRLEQKQSTKLVMTTELRQAITMLHYSSLELTQFLQTEALNNPLMELSNEPTWDEPFLESPFTNQIQDHNEWTNPIEFIQKEDNLHAHLLQQVFELSLRTSEQTIVKFLIENINDAGYLTISLQEVKELLQISSEQVCQAFSKVKLLNPIGIGARSLTECLLWQLEDANERSLLAEKIVKSDLELLAKRNWRSVAEKYSVSVQDVQSAVDLILSLEPKPGSIYGETKASFLLPDITVQKVDDEYVVIIHDDTVPTVRVNEQYRHLLTRGKETEAESYLNQQYRRVMWIIHSLEQRRVTLLKITKALIKKQSAFLEKGRLHLKPLTLKDIAQEIGMHESTVSRAINEKMIDTPKGLFEMKDFFTAGIQATKADNVSSHVVKELITEMIAEEDKRKPLSDQKIANLLKAEKAIAISRRTVAKYREQLHIPSSLKRRRY